MEDSAAISDALKITFAAANFIVWTGLFLYIRRLSASLRRLEHETAADRPRD